MSNERIIHKFNPKNQDKSAATNNNKSPDPYYILRGHKSSINSIVFDKIDPNILYSGSSDGELKIWNIEEKKLISSHTIHKENAGVLGLQSILLNSTKDHHLISQGRDGTVKIWKSTESTITLIDTIETNSISLGKCSSVSTCNKINLSNNIESGNSTTNDSNNNNVENSNLLAISSDETVSVVEIWDIKSKEVVFKTKKADGFGMSMSLKMFNDNNNKTFLCSGYENGSLVCWDLRNIDNPIVSSKLHSEPVLSFDISSNQGISGGGDNNIIEFSINNDKFEVLQKHQINNNGIADIKIRNDEKIFITGGWDHRVRVFNFKKHTPLAILKYHEESIYSVDFNSNNILASASKDMRIALWSIYK